MRYPKECPLVQAVFGMESDEPQLFELTGVELDEYGGIDAMPIETREEGITLDIDDRHFKPLNAAAKAMVRKARENVKASR